MRHCSRRGVVSNISTPFLFLLLHPPEKLQLVCKTTQPAVVPTTQQWVSTPLHIVLASTHTVHSGHYTQQWVSTPLHTVLASTHTVQSGHYTQQWVSTPLHTVLAPTHTVQSGHYTQQWVSTPLHIVLASTHTVQSGHYCWWIDLNGGLTHTCRFLECRVDWWYRSTVHTHPHTVSWEWDIEVQLMHQATTDGVKCFNPVDLFLQATIFYINSSKISQHPLLHWVYNNTTVNL